VPDSMEYVVEVHEERYYAVLVCAESAEAAYRHAQRVLQRGAHVHTHETLSPEVHHAFVDYEETSERRVTFQHPDVLDAIDVVDTPELPEEFPDA
jgi:hypothetical protein